VRILLRLEFKGTSHCGWQLQATDSKQLPNTLTSIQFELEKSIALYLHLKDERVVVQGCGRTDAGVHAKEFYAHFDISELHIGKSEDEIEKLRHGVNCILPQSVVLTHAAVVPDSFHAQKDVLKKTYQYQVLLRRAKPTLEEGFVYWLPCFPRKPYFDFNVLNLALKKLEGEHDFNAFMAAGADVKSTVRTLYKCELMIENRALKNQSECLLKLQFTGNGFLKQMVRNICGTVLEIAQSKRKLELMEQLLDPKNISKRTEAGLCAPPEGLYLLHVDYGDEKKLPF